IVRQLFERRVADATVEEREALHAGPGRSALAVLQRDGSSHTERDISFAVLHGLYWLTVILADRAPLLLAVDDAHWAAEASLRWLPYLPPRLAGSDVSLIVALRPDAAVSQARLLLAVRAEATTIQPRLLSREAVAAIFRNVVGRGVDDEVVSLAHHATGGHPFFLRGLLRAPQRGGDSAVVRSLEELASPCGPAGGARQVRAPLQRPHPPGPHPPPP